MKHNYIPIEDVERMFKLWEQKTFSLPNNDWMFLPALLGLKSSHPEKSWMNSSNRISFLYIDDSKRWLLSKIKYSI